MSWYHFQLIQLPEWTIQAIVPSGKTYMLRKKISFFWESHLLESYHYLFPIQYWRNRTFFSQEGNTWPLTEAKMNLWIYKKKNVKM